MVLYKYATPIILYYWTRSSLPPIVHIVFFSFTQANGGGVDDVIPSSSFGAGSGGAIAVLATELTGFGTVQAIGGAG